MNETKMANGLGWFSLVLGLAEIVAGKAMAKALGLKSEGLVRAFGAREIVAGLGILLRPRKGPGVWARVAGDALDLAVLGSALGRSNPKRKNAAIALAVVSPVVVLDVVCGQRLGLEA